VGGVGRGKEGVLDWKERISGGRRSRIGMHLEDYFEGLKINVVLFACVGSWFSKCSKYCVVVLFKGKPFD
jgi:hypothetical protein